MVFSSCQTWAVHSITSVTKNNDLNYRYNINYAGIINDFSSDVQVDKKTFQGVTQSRKILIEISIESIYDGFEWLPLNPLITDELNYIYSDYKVIAEPPAGNHNINIKYLINIPARKAKYLTFYEEGSSDDGKKAYRMTLKNIPF
jgi:hypothetical protein